MDFLGILETVLMKKKISLQGMSPYPGSERGNGVESNETSSSLGGGGSISSSLPRGLKRPSLPGTDYHSILELEKPSTVLYDYSKLNAWLVVMIKVSGFTYTYCLFRSFDD